MKIVVDDKIPFIRGVFEPFAEVAYVPGAEIAPEDVADADALVVRTRTKCGPALLDGSKARFIATATIGHDHIDSAYCAERRIEWVNAPGCNSSAVTQYMASLILNLESFNPRGKTIGVVGFGHVGSKVAELADILGMEVLANDPPLEAAGFESPLLRKIGGFHPIGRVRGEADMITFHVPLEKGGPHPTFHMADYEFIGGLRDSSILVNTSRGAVVENDALKSALSAGRLAGASLDVWENEPDIDAGLLELLDFATPHIAGYSIEGKANGTMASVRALARFFGLPLDDWTPEIPPPENPAIRIPNKGMEPLEAARHAVNAAYDIRRDDDALRRATEGFEKLRGGYEFRREPTAYEVELETPDHETTTLLGRIGFRTPNPRLDNA